MTHRAWTAMRGLSLPLPALSVPKAALVLPAWLARRLHGSDLADRRTVPE